MRKGREAFERASRWVTGCGFLLPLVLCLGTVASYSGCGSEGTVGAHADVGFIDAARGGQVAVTLDAGGAGNPTATVPPDPWLWLVPLSAICGLVLVLLSRRWLLASASLAWIALAGTISSVVAAFRSPSDAAISPPLQGLSEVDAPAHIVGYVIRFAPGFAIALGGGLLLTIYQAANSSLLVDATTSAKLAPQEPGQSPPRRATGI